MPSSLLKNIYLSSASQPFWSHDASWIWKNMAMMWNTSGSDIRLLPLSLEAQHKPRNSGKRFRLGVWAFPNESFHTVLLYPPWLPSCHYWEAYAMVLWLGSSHPFCPRKCVVILLGINKTLKGTLKSNVYSQTKGNGNKIAKFLLLLFLWFCKAAIMQLWSCKTTVTIAFSSMRTQKRSHDIMALEAGICHKESDVVLLQKSGYQCVMLILQFVWEEIFEIRHEVYT